MVLASPRPDFNEEQAVGLADASFGVLADSSRNLGSERDQTFLLLAPDAVPVAVMKVSNAAEDPAILDMEALAVLHIGRVDPELPVAVPRAAPDSSAPQDPTTRRVAVEGDGGTHWVRIYDVLPGGARTEASELSDEAIIAWGETSARLTRALRGFFHPSMQRTMPWDVQHALTCRPMLADVRDPELRGIVADVLDRFEEVVIPVWPSLRAQAVHGDLTLDNVLLDERGFISGIIDFGDMSHSALAADLAPVLDSLAVGRQGVELYRAARLLLDGYQRVTPLEPVELDLLGDLWAARCAVTVAISSWRSARGLEDADFAERYNPVSLATLETFLATGWQALPAELGGAGMRVPDADLVVRRSQVMGPALEALSYEAPIQMVSARGVWMTDVDDVTYLDAYNNVPCVGHTHPRVVEAIARQARVLNTNMRYLHTSVVELAERLVAECGGDLDTVMFVNSGSEANDLAWRMAVAFTGNTGGLCTDFAYHGISEPIAALSPECWGPEGKPTHVETWMPQDHYRGEHLGTEDFAAALENLSLRGLAPAATILDGVVTSDGFRDLDPTHVQALVRMTREAGGLWIADEVQGGHGRTGDAMWSYQRTGIQPDFVTLGKPMGNGHPVAAVITRREIAEQFARGTVFFSTFGGNPVSVAAAHAVLDVLADEHVLPRTQAAGDALRHAVRHLKETFPVIGDVRGMGLANGIELVTDPTSKEPHPRLASAVKEGMRQRQVLVGTCGRHGNVLKVRPPLAFTVEEVPQFVDALCGSLSDSIDA